MEKYTKAPGAAIFFCLKILKKVLRFKEKRIL